MTLWPATLDKEDKFAYFILQVGRHEMTQGLAMQDFLGFRLDMNSL